MVIGCLYIWTGVLWAMSAESEEDKEGGDDHLTHNTILEAYGYLSSFVGLFYVLSSLFYFFLFLRAAGQDEEQKKEAHPEMSNTGAENSLTEEV